MLCKIYMLTNKCNNKIYIGQTWLEYEERMGKNGENYNSSTYLYNAILKYGHYNFEYTTLALCETQEEADNTEYSYIKFYESQNSDFGYNLKDGGRGGKHSEETKIRISNTLKSNAEKWSPEELARRSASISGYWIGKKRGPQSEEKKQHNSEFFKEWHANNDHPMLGKHHTEEAKKKMSIASTGKIDSPETTKKRSLAKLTKPEKEQIVIAAYKNGETIKDIIKNYDIGMGTIYRILDRNNIKLRQKNEEVDIY